MVRHTDANFIQALTYQIECQQLNCDLKFDRIAWYKPNNVSLMIWLCASNTSRVDFKCVSHEVAPITYSSIFKFSCGQHCKIKIKLDY